MKGACTISVGHPPIYQPNYIGIPTRDINAIAAIQTGSQWCWAACLQMIFNFHKVNLRQEQIVKRTFSGYTPRGFLPDWPATLPIISHNLNYSAQDNNGCTYTVYSSFSNGAPEASTLIYELSNQQPVLLSYYTSSNTAHAVVVTGCSYVQSLVGPTVQTLIVRDPDAYNPNVDKFGRVEYAGLSLAQLIQAHWCVRVVRQLSW